MGKASSSKAEKNERRRNQRRLVRLNSSKPLRSPNRFILYRRHKQNEFFNDPNNPIGMRKLSKVIAKMWEKEPPEVKNHWDKVAEGEKLKSSYKTSFDNIIGLDISMSNESSELGTSTFVNATIPSAETHKSCSLKISDNFIFESPQPSTPSDDSKSFTIDSLSPQPSPQLSSQPSPQPSTQPSPQPSLLPIFNDDYLTTGISNVSIDSSPELSNSEIVTLDDPMLTGSPLYGEYSYFSDKQDCFFDDGFPLYTEGLGGYTGFMGEFEGYEFIGDNYSLGVLTQC